MTEQDILNYLADKFDDLGYGASPYLKRHPETVTGREIIDMSEEDFAAYTEANRIIDNIRTALPRRPTGIDDLN
ncbi:hypothetical protein [Actinomyces qiguomingii]|uniref:hypothetical protein n=1 Tax=Actinomyces qiguomingii TaxID=2057800 RepID=UPI000CA01151|nr:hypothetical protein [Actinomyces qiguomingii]